MKGVHYEIQVSQGLFYVYRTWWDECPAERGMRVFEQSADCVARCPTREAAEAARRLMTL